MQTSYSYPGLSDQARIKIQNMIDVGLISITNLPSRHEASVVQKFILDYLKSKQYFK